MRQAGGAPAAYPLFTMAREIEDARVEALIAPLAAVAVTEGTTPTAVPFVNAIRANRPTVLRRGILRPSVCFVLQGRKRFHFGSDVLAYGAGAYIASSIDVPAAGHVTRATPSAPYFGLSIEWSPREIASVVMDANITPPAASGARSVLIGHASAHVLDVLHRLVSLLAAPRDAAFLAPPLKRELIYRLLTSDGGDLVHQSILFDRHADGVGRAIAWLKDNYARPLRIDDLAKRSHMSVSSLHHKFKAVTSLGPLQYQKRLRLEEARRNVVAGMDASRAAFAVGYESVSQFSREYRRLFGLPPQRDARAVRGSGGTARDDL